MPDEAVSLRDINWRETFPFTHLFRAFRVAVHPSKLLLALVALGFLWCGGLILDGLWLHNYKVAPADLAYLGMKSSAYGPMRAFAGEIPAREVREEARAEAEAGEPVYGVFYTFFSYEVIQANDVLMGNGALMGSGGAFDAIWNFIAVGPMWLWSTHWLFALIYTAYFLLVWSIFGGAISRIAAVHVARDEKISVRHALSFSTSKAVSFIFAPIIPVLIVFGIGVVISIASTILFHIPYVGPVVAGIFFCLALLGGFVITLVILGTIGGFNLMYPTVAVEGSDSFDAISRSFSYVFARPWRMLWYTLVAVVYGAICYLFVRFFIWMVLAVTWFFMSWFLGHRSMDVNAVLHPYHPADVWPLLWERPGAGDPRNPLAYSPHFEHLKSTEAISAGLMVWWNYLVIGLIGAFAISFYFSANTIIYYLMRREVDATELDDVYVEETDDDVEEPAASAAAGAAAIRETATVRVYEAEERPASDRPADTTPPPAEPPAPGAN